MSMINKYNNRTKLKTFLLIKQLNLMIKIQIVVLFQIYILVQRKQIQIQRLILNKIYLKVNYYHKAVRMVIQNQMLDLQETCLTSKRIDLILQLINM